MIIPASDVPHRVIDQIANGVASAIEEEGLILPPQASVRDQSVKQ